MILLRLAVFAILAFLIAPLLIIILFSFHATPALSFPFTGFSLRWYQQVFTDVALGSALLKSLKIAIWTAIVTIVLGASVSLAWLRWTVWSRWVCGRCTRPNRQCACPPTWKKMLF